MTIIKALILCNNPIAIPGIKEFLFFGKVGAIGIPKKNKEMQQILETLMQGTGVPLLLIDKKEYKEQISNAIDTYAVNIGLMMTFPFILPEAITNKPLKGFINFHYGLLPQCRGPQPILWHLLNNDTHCGVTIHKVDNGIDTGQIIMQEKLLIDQKDTYGLLQSKLAHVAAKLAENLLKILSYGSIIPGTNQDEAKAAYYEMPDAAVLTINWQKNTATEILRLVNACNPWNKGAGTSIQGWFFGITEVEIVGPVTDSNAVAGTIMEVNEKDGLLVKTIDNQLIKINIVYMPEGFFSGYRLAEFNITKEQQFGT